MGLERLKGAIAAAGAQAAEACCAETCRMAQALCPVESGNLRGSIGMEISGDGGGAVGVVSVRAEYAAAVELGTYKQSAKPFLQPAFDQVKGRVAAEVANCIRGGC